METSYLQKFNKFSMLHNRIQHLNKDNNQVIMKLSLTLFFTLIAIFGSSQCAAQCSNVVSNGDFENGWNSWTKGSGWGRSQNYGAGNSTYSVNNQLDNSSGSDLSQSVTGLSGSTTLQLTLDAYPQSPNTGTAFLDMYLGSTKYMRLTNANGGSGATVTLYNSATGISTATWTYSTWKKGIKINIPWNGTTNTATLKFTFISTGSLRDWGIDNVSLIPLVVPSVTVLGNPSTTRKTTVQLTATPTNGGTAPTYLWYKNNVLKGTGNPWTDSAWEKGTDTIKVKMVSNLSCRTTDTASATFYLTVLSLTDIKYYIYLDTLHVQFTKNPDDLVNVYTFNERSGLSSPILSTTEMRISIPHTSRYYLLVSGNYSKFIGPFELVADERKRTISTKQLLGQYTN